MKQEVRGPPALEIHNSVLLSLSTSFFRHATVLEIFQEEIAQQEELQRSSSPQEAIQLLIIYSNAAHKESKSCNDSIEIDTLS
jgi:hypothetical protein